MTTQPPELTDERIAELLAGTTGETPSEPFTLEYAMACVRGAYGQGYLDALKAPEPRQP